MGSLLSAICIALIALSFACNVDRPTQPTDDLLAPAAKGGKKGKNKVDLCHIDEDGIYHLINVAEPAVDAHLAHGDDLAGGDVLDENCEPVLPREITVELPGGATMEFVWIEPGTFTMGSPDSELGRDPDEGPQHEVTISQGFYLGKYEITQGQWEVVMTGDTPWAGKEYVKENPNHPAVYISWEDMQAFISKLNQAAGSSVYRLPTEAEWEYACRAGTETRWSFGDDETLLGNYAWYNDNTWNVGEKYAHEVGTTLPNPWGLYDMHGNVYEWCQDWWYRVYTTEAQKDPTGPSSGSHRTVRSGGFYSVFTADRTRSANRDASLDERFFYLGARLVMIK